MGTMGNPSAPAGTDAASRYAPVRLRPMLRLAGWNVLLLVAGLAAIGFVGEAWLRLTVPFMSSYAPTVFVPGVGVLLRPDTETRWTNGLDAWTVARTNRLGFLDREPPSPERAAEGCHIAMIGDSFVAARQVPIAEKFHVRFEEMAARELPALGVTVSAFGKNGTGQINQLAFYEEYARPLRPRLVVLVFVANDYRDNFPLWRYLSGGFDPEHLPYVSAVRTADGGFILRPPDPDWRSFRPSPRSRTRISQALRGSWFFSWLQIKAFRLRSHEIQARTWQVRRMEWLSRHPAHARLLDGWQPLPTMSSSHHALFAEEKDLPFLSRSLAFTSFALEEFKKRADRDGAALVVLASHGLSLFGGGPLARLNEMAAARGIPVIDQGDFIRRHGAELRDAQWEHDGHWNPAGHRWAAAALLEYLKRNPNVCVRPPAGGRTRGREDEGRSNALGAQGRAGG